MFVSEDYQSIQCQRMNELLLFDSCLVNTRFFFVFSDELRLSSSFKQATLTFLQIVTYN